MTKLDKWIYFCTQEFGCVICKRNGVFSPADYHHLLSGGRRMGDYIGIPLCPSHHRGNNAGVISRDQCKRSFEAEYGLESAMLAEVQNAYTRSFA